jgi:Carboxypeptidase regulatory-like domain/TonB dependent receptor
MRTLASHRFCGRRILYAISSFAIVLIPALLLAQGYFGTVSGLVTDSSGAIIQGARIVLLDEDKGYRFTTTSNNAGQYLFVSIPPGSYTVSAEAKGFEKTVRTHLKLNISENPSANLTMKVASTTESVEVKAETTTVHTEDAVTGQVVDRRFINNLPLIDRNVQALIYLAPGVNDQSDQNSAMDTNGTNFISNGSRGASADILMDGATVTNFEPNGGITYATYVPNPESVEEFKVEQSNFSAEYGFSGGSIVNMITRSGTNTFHGEVYDFIRNTITDANNWFNDNATPIIPIPPVHRHDFGGTIGGPIIKNKTFFFFDWDGTLQSSMSTYLAGVPSAAERTGDFSELCGGDGPNGPAPGATFVNGICNNPAGQLYDPYSGVYSSNDGGAIRALPIPNNRVDQYISPGCNPALLPAGSSCPPSQFEPTPGVAGNLIDPVAAKMMALFPQPNMPGNPYLNWIASGATPSDNEEFDLKIDHRFNQKNLMSGKYSHQWSNTSPFNCFKTFIDPCGSGANKGNSNLFSLNEVYTINPTLLLTTTLGFTRGTTLIFAYNSSLNPNPLSTLGFPSYLQENGFNGVPAIFLGDYAAAAYPNAGNDPYGNYKQGQDTGQLSVLLSKIHGPHELKFGFEGRVHQQNYIQTNAPLGFFTFSYQGSAQCPAPGITGTCNTVQNPTASNPANSVPGGGDDMASFLMGQVTSGCAGNGCGSYYEIQFRPASENYQYAAFVQDNWKTTSKLTLNLGIRYDVSLPRTERFNRMNWWNPNVTNPLNGGSLSYDDQFNGPTTLALRGGELFNSPSVRSDWLTDWTDIQPRFGLAYQFAPKMVVRGGYGIYYSQTRSGANGLLSYGSQGFNQYTNAITTYQNAGNVPWLHLSNPFPNGLIQPPGSALGQLNDVGYGAIGPLRTHAAALTPYEQSWTLGIERQLPGNVVVAANYIGKKGTHLYFAGDNNRDILGPAMETNPNLVNNLETYVTNPFSSQNGGPISDPNSTLSSAQVQEFQLQMPFPEYTSVTTDEPPIANSIYHALQLTANKAYSNGLELTASFTWSKSIDDSSIYDTNVTWLANYGPESGFALQDPNNPKSERSLSTFDIPATLKFSYSYDLPLGRGKAFGGEMPRWLDGIIGGWKTNGIWQIRDGWPLQFFVSGGGVPLPTYGPQRPNFFGKPTRNYGSDTFWVNNFFANASNTAPNSAIQAPAAFTLGNAPRTTADIRTPRSFTSDLSIAKQFLLSSAHEGIRLELRLEAENAFNHPVFGTPDSGIGDGNFGVISTLAVNPRQGQLVLKLNF